MRAMMASCPGILFMVGATFDLFGTGKTVVKGAFGHYYDMRFSGELSDAYDTITTATSNQGATLSYVQYPWNGAAANGLPLMSGVSVIKPCATYPATPCTAAGASSIRQFGAPYNPAAPSTAVSLNSVDPHIKNPNSYEVVGGVSQELGPGIAVNVNYIYRRYVNLIWNQLNGISSSNYVPCQTSPTAAVPCTITSPTGTQTTFSVAATPCPTTVAPTLPAQCAPVTVYMPNITLPAGYTITNIPDYHRAYNGLELTVRKVMTKNWMMDGGFTIQSSRQYWTAADAYQDPTNIAQQNGAQYTLGGAGVTNAKWIGRLAGRYRLPWYGITVSAGDDFRQGYCSRSHHPGLVARQLSSFNRRAARAAMHPAVPPPAGYGYARRQDLQVPRPLQRGALLRSLQPVQRRHRVGSERDRKRINRKPHLHRSWTAGRAAGGYHQAKVPFPAAEDKDQTAKEFSSICVKLSVL